MAREQFFMKDGLGSDAVKRIATALSAADSGFDTQAFRRSAMRGLKALELKARVGHVIGALRKHLPQDTLQALDVLVRAGANWEPRPEGAGDFFSFAAWPVIDFVGAHGLDHPEESLDALRKLTGLFSAEFAIRPFLERHERLTLTRLRRWTKDPDPNVRRLVSEGTRPRLPWGGRLKRFQSDPTPVIRLLERLKDDDALYVRRSVANNVNDISKDHPDRVVELVSKWSRNASDERLWIVRHATRTLVKAGHPGALKVLGFDPKAKVDVVGLSVTPRTLKLGGALTLNFELRSRARRAQPLIVDYAVHHVKKTGERTAKVFKLKTLKLAAKAVVEVKKKHSIRKISTRVYYPGRHLVEILVNGSSRGRAEFDLKL